MKKRTKKTLSISLKVFTRLLLGIVLCAILNVSMNVIGTAFFSDVVGYQIYEQAEDGTVNQIEEYHYKAGEAEKTASDMDLKDNQMFTAIRVVPDKTQTTLNVISQLLMLVVYGIFPYHILWQFGNRDDTNVRYRGQRPDPWRGVRIGMIATIPFAVLWVLMFAVKWNIMPSGYVQVYRIASFPFMPYINWLLGASQTLADVAVWRILLLALTLLFVPAVCGVAYRMGGHQFSLSEYLTFKKKPDKEENGEI